MTLIRRRLKQRENTIENGAKITRIKLKSTNKTIGANKLKRLIRGHKKRCAYPLTAKSIKGMQIMNGLYCPLQVYYNIKQRIIQYKPYGNYLF